MEVRRFNYIEIEVPNEEELVLLFSKENRRSGKIRGFTFGLFSEITECERRNMPQHSAYGFQKLYLLGIRKPHVLRPYSGLLPIIEAPITDYQQYHIEAGKTKRVVVAQKTIVDFLNQYPDFEPHAKLIARLQKPYLE